ncbi:MAG: MFS transporter [Leptospirillum sp.]|jgi:metabolite-proton symporter
MSLPVSKAQILLASLVGTTIEFFDFYIFATASVLVFPALFFPPGNATTATLQSLATFALAFITRPIGAVIFGHFGDRVGRKATLVAALLTMGLSTILIGLLPTYGQIGLVAPFLLALCRLGQGLGLGGEWGGAVLLATENAPPGRRAWYGMFPQLGAPIGFILSTGTFLALSHFTTHDEFTAWGWRVPFLLSAILVMIGLWIRLRLIETPDFRRAMERGERASLPALSVLRNHFGPLLVGLFSLLSTFVLFYLMTVFALGWGTTHLGYSRESFLMLQMAGVLCFALMIPVSARYADHRGCRESMMIATILIFIFGLSIGSMMVANHPGLVLLFFVLGFSVTGLTYGPAGTVLAELFPTPVRYTGASLAFNLAGIVGASPAPYIATRLAATYGLASVGWYLCVTAVLTFMALLAVRPIKEP